MEMSSNFCDQCGRLRAGEDSPCPRCGAANAAPDRGSRIFWVSALLCLFVVSVAWGFAYRDRASSRTVAAVVNGDSILVDDLERRTDFRARQAAYHRPDAAPQDLDRLRWKVLGEVLGARIVEDAAEKAGVFVSAAEIEDMVRDYRQGLNVSADDAFARHVADWYGSDEWFRESLRTDALFRKMTARESDGWFDTARQTASVKVFIEQPGGAGGGCCSSGGGRRSCCSTAPGAGKNG